MATASACVARVLGAAAWPSDNRAVVGAVVEALEEQPAQTSRVAKTAAHDAEPFANYVRRLPEFWRSVVTCEREGFRESPLQHETVAGHGPDQTGRVAESVTSREPRSRSARTLTRRNRFIGSRLAVAVLREPGLDIASRRPHSYVLLSAGACDLPSPVEPPPGDQRDPCGEQDERK